jgi:hypothetical protein
MEPIRRIILAAAALALAVPAAPAGADVPLPVPPEQRGRIDAERSGTHDANSLRTVFWNYGMVGDYPADPGGVDLSVFHSAEAPKGSGMNYSDGVTPFVLAKVRLPNGLDAYIMETGYRERQEASPLHPERIMRFEPRPGYFEPDPNKNRARSPAISSDPRTWPASWPDRLDDVSDPGWPGAWNGYFGKRPAADQESYTVMDDDFYDKWWPDLQADSRDPNRMGLGLRVEVRGFQWANPQAGNVIFWHYDITNEGTTDYDDNVIFGLYMDSGVGGSALSCEGVYESDDDNAFFDRSLGLNLVYTWDKGSRGKDLAGNCSPTGYMGYAYLETPGNPFDGLDNDRDGITDERRDGGPGTRIEGRPAIRAWVESHVDLASFEAYYGPLENRPAYRAGVWWTGDEDMDWVADLHDLGADGVEDEEAPDAGEGDGIPTAGETNFDQTDLNESDQIGLTGFKMNRIKPGASNPDPRTDNILFYTESQNWPQRLYDFFTDPNPQARFDSALVANSNIGFLFASGPFKLQAGRRERFSLALAFGADLAELRQTTRVVQQIYNANYQFAVPPPLPTLKAEAGDRYVKLSWDNVSELGIDPVSFLNDFEGYRIYRSTDPNFLDPRVQTSGRGNPLPVNGKPIQQFDLANGVRGYSRVAVDGVQYWLGDETGIEHTWTDTTVVNGQTYYYALCAYDYGSPPSVPDSLAFYPSENAITVSRNLRGGTILPVNVVEVRPEPRVAGWVPAAVDSFRQVAGRGTGTVRAEIVNSLIVPHDHLFKLTFSTPDADSIRATGYSLWDSTAGRLLFKGATDVDGRGIGPTGAGLLPVVRVPVVTTLDSARTGYTTASTTNVKLRTTYQSAVDINLLRVGFPDDITIEFDDVVRDTSIATGSVGFTVPRPARFRVIAHTPQGDRQLDFRFLDADPTSPTGGGRLNRPNEYIDILTEAPWDSSRDEQITYRVQYDGLSSGTTADPPGLGDQYEIRVVRPLSHDDVFVFRAEGSRVDAAAARAGWTEAPYVVPNPYIGSASFEPARFAVSGRGERRIEFRAIPQGSVIRIYSVRGELVQTLRQDGSVNGYVAWNLRTKDNLDVAPGLYVFHVEAPGLDAHVGKFAIVK